MRSTQNCGRCARRWGLAFGLTSVALPAFAQTPPPPSSADTRASGVQEIVVTAQKREQNLQKVPISVTALTGDTLKANRVQDVRDLTSIAPNLTVRLSSGGAQLPVYSMRGIVTGGGAVGVDKGISLYLDGVYLQNTSGSVFELADVERIEVLKGPQGTLFGRNATGGAISIITKDPTGKFGGSQEFTAGNEAAFRSKTHVELPKFGPFSASFDYLHSQHRGDTRNLGAGTVWDYGPATDGKVGSYTSPKWLGSENINAFHAALKAGFDPDLYLVYKFDYSKNNYTPNAQGQAYLPGLPGSGDGLPETVLDEIYLASAAAGNPMTPITSKRPDAVNNAMSSPGFTKNQGHNLTAKYRFSDGISVKNILAFRKSEQFLPGFQIDGLGGLINAPVSLAPIGVPVTLPPGGVLASGSLASFDPTAPFLFIGNNATDKQRQWSDELQLNITTNWFNLTAGYLHFHDFQQDGAIANTFNTIVLNAVQGQRTPAAGTDFAFPANPGYVPSHVTVNSDAWFVQPEIHLTHRLDLVGGARITIDDKRGAEFAPDQVAAGGTPAAPVSSPIRYHDTEASYLLGLNYRPTDTILTYAKYATGYISGGTIATITFAPEKARSWEVGIKADLFDRHVRSNFAGFYAKYKDIQVATSGLLTGVASAALYAVAIVPSSDANAYGFEWENTMVPFNGLTLTANTGYTHFHILQSTVFPGFAVASGAPGYLPYQRPKWTADVSAQYDTPPIWGEARLTFRIDGNFKSKELLSSDISLGNGPDGIVDPNLRKAATAPAHWIVNGRVALTNLAAGPTKIEIAAWGRNILNNKDIAQISVVDVTPPTVANGYVPLGVEGSTIYERARTFGVDVHMAF